ncbi:MAG: PaaI family thioesterase [Desulfuromonas sp.]|uniref:PaaI family thioesterase n=1 Tax=Desulfuromonas sp. TaxID=892 RepID=UPI000CBBEBD1|nr:PaaI family thioesterase [Desulfuromonas sp.]PLX86039.1 MAG: PaaI family thioesterase [Desulfuromonas sp.]
MSRLLVDGDALRREGESQFEMEAWVDSAPFEVLLGMTIEEAREGRAVLTMPFRVKLAMGGGYMHGGALTALADTAVAMAIKSLLPAGTVFATIELTSRFLAPVKEGTVTATASVTGPEERTFRGEAVLADEGGREVLRFTALFKVARGQGIGE